MKRTVTVSLNELLSGNSKKKTKLQSPQTPNLLVKAAEENSNANSNINVDSTVESIDLLGDEFTSSPLKIESDSSKPHIVPVGDNVKSQSIKSFLMRKMPKEKKKDNGPLVISLDDEDFGMNDTIKNNTGTLSDDDIHIVDEVIDLKNIFLQSSKIAEGNNIKRTKFTDLFAGFPKASMGDVDTASFGPIKRLNIISNLKELEPPLPRYQLVSPDEQFIAKSDIPIKLNKREFSNDSYVNSLKFLPNEYGLLNEQSKKDQATSCTKTVQYSIQSNKYSLSWPELLKPRSLKEVLLEPKLKTNVSEWIQIAINRLKKPTTRNKLLKSYKEEIDEFENFIIHDDEDDEESNNKYTFEQNKLDEFVPLSILHGDGIGKDTLLYTIANEYSCQVYEINTSQNRGKKDILEILEEYCTTYYVKDKNIAGIILISDVDVIFKEHDKFFWLSIEKLLLKSRKPVILTCQDLSFIPPNLINICLAEESLFSIKKVALRSVVAFLEKYCKTLELSLESEILQTIADRNNRDIRKCLLELQFWFSSGNKVNMFSEELANLNTRHIDDIHEVYQLLEMNSISDVVHNSVYDKSLISQDLDSTVMTSDILRKFQSSTNDQFKWDKDYIIDYKIHLPFLEHYPLLPYEINPCNYMRKKMFAYSDYLLSFNYRYPLKYSKIKSASISFIETRIKNSGDIGTSKMRRTRNSSKINDIVSSFQGHLLPNKEIDENVAFDFSLTTKKHLCEEINPYVHEIAKHEALSSEYNKQLYKHCTHDIPLEKHNEMVRQLIEENLFKPIRFFANSDKVLSSWK